MRASSKRLKTRPRLCAVFNNLNALGLEEGRVGLYIVGHTVNVGEKRQLGFFRAGVLNSLERRRHGVWVDVDRDGHQTVLIENLHHVWNIDRSHQNLSASWVLPHLQEAVERRANTQADEAFFFGLIRRKQLGELLLPHVIVFLVSAFSILDHRFEVMCLRIDADTSSCVDG